MDDQSYKRSHSLSSKNKHKKKKKKHHHKKKKETKSSSSESGSEMEWVEASSADVAKESAVKTEESKNKRDEWMSDELFVATLSKEELRSGSSRQKKLEIQKIKKDKEDAIQRERELNPYLKDNGKGLPETSDVAESLALPTTSVGDGGYSYLKKAYYRIQEQSQKEGKSMEEVAVERWGSLDKLLTMINEAEERMKSNSKTKYNSEKHRWSDKHERKYTEHFRKPSNDKRSPSYSPERFYKYQKPKHHSRNDKKLGHYSSAENKRRNRELGSFENESRFSYSHQKSPEHRKSYSPEKNETSVDFKGQRIPAWKKTSYVKKEKEVEKMKDIFVWDKKNSFQDGGLSHERRFEEFPAWKKSKDNFKRSTSSEHKDSNSPKSIPSEDVESTKKQQPSEDLANIMTEDDLNKLAAKCTKAELLGNLDLAAKLKKQLEEARQILKNGGKILPAQREREKVMLTKIDSCGQERPIHYSEDISESQSKQRKKQTQKFFDDGSRYSLKQMFEREKLTTADDNIEMFMEMAAECKDADDENETSGISKKATNKMAHHLQEEKDVGRAIQQHQKRNSALEKCNYCLDQPSMKRHLIVTKYSQVYLSIPGFQSLVEGHCLIVPNRHVQSFLALDEEEWREVEDLKRSLRNMFLEQNKNIIILETSRSFRYFLHAFLEVIPVPEEISDMAPLYFKKAILESETEWANNVKLIDLSKKGLRHSVPKNLPYFCVQFDPKVHSGYAHVIEDERHFERNFGKEVVGGMLDIDYNYLFKNKREDPTKKSQETVNFIKMWENFYKNSS